MNNCPFPETLIEYIEGRIKGKHKQDIYNHIANCQDCMDNLQAVFDMPTEEELKKEKVPRETIEKAKRIPKMYRGEADMKKCPYCAEEIQDDAIVCKHCKRDLKEWSIYDPIKKIVRDTKKELAKYREYKQKKKIICSKRGGGLGLLASSYRIGDGHILCYPCYKRYKKEREKER